MDEEAVRLAAEWRPDVVHLHSFWLWHAARAIREQTGAPLVYTVHSLDSAEYDIGHGPPECLTQWHVQRDAIEHADRVIALTADEERLISAYCPNAASRVRIVGNGIADSPAARRATRRRERRAPVILFTGRFVDRKGVGDLIEAVPDVIEAAPDTRFVLAGGHRGCSGEEMRRRWLPATLSGRLDSVHFTGWLTPAEMFGWYQEADVLVVPSWYEPFGMVVLEGMLYGLAIAAAAVGGPKEILDHGRTGLLFPARDPARLASALLRLVLDRGLSRALARAAANDVRRKWLWPQVVKRMRLVYDEAAASA